MRARCVLNVFYAHGNACNGEADCTQCAHDVEASQRVYGWELTQHQLHSSKDDDEVLQCHFSIGAGIQRVNRLHSSSLNSRHAYILNEMAYIYRVSSRTYTGSICMISIAAVGANTYVHRGRYTCTQCVNRLRSPTPVSLHPAPIFSVGIAYGTNYISLP